VTFLWGGVAHINFTHYVILQGGGEVGRGGGCYVLILPTMSIIEDIFVYEGQGGSNYLKEL